MDTNHRFASSLGPGDYDVAIIGGGFTGLWTAYYLQARNPNLAIVVIEANHVGFGASGRNGGWCIGETAAASERWCQLGGEKAAQAMHAALYDTVDEMERRIVHHDISCDFVRGGELVLARNRGQQRRLQGAADGDEWEWLTAAEATALCHATNVSGAIYRKHTAVVHPGKLVHQLADVVRQRGAHIVEGVAVSEASPGVVHTVAGSVRAKHVVVAVEAYERSLKRRRREMLPLNSMMIATEPLSSQQWEEIGLHTRPVFSDARFRVVYGQRTADGRIAFGGRVKPYHFGSVIPPDQWYQSHYDVDEIVFDFFPQLRNVAITHRWGGVLGVPRNWTPFVDIDQRSRIYQAGGYVGEGVAATNLAGRCIAAAVCDPTDPLVSLAWVRDRSRRWAPEPLRFAEVTVGAQLYSLGDASEQRLGRPAGAIDAIVQGLRR